MTRAARRRVKRCAIYPDQGEDLSCSSVHALPFDLDCSASRLREASPAARVGKTPLPMKRSPCPPYSSRCRPVTCRVAANPTTARFTTCGARASSRSAKVPPPLGRSPTSTDTTLRSASCRSALALLAPQAE